MSFNWLRTQTDIKTKVKKSRTDSNTIRATIYPQSTKVEYNRLESQPKNARLV